MSTINVKGTRSAMTDREFESKLAQENTRSSVMGEKWIAQQAEMAARSLRHEADYFHQVFTDAAKQLRQAAELENSLRNKQFQTQRALVRQEEQNARKWERIKLQDERRQQREILSNRQKDVQFATREQKAKQADARQGNAWIAAQRNAEKTEKRKDQAFEARLQREYARTRRVGGSWMTTQNNMSYDSDYRTR